MGENCACSSTRVEEISFIGELIFPGTRDFKTPDVHVDEFAGVDQTLRVARDCRFKAIFSDTSQPLRLAGAGGRDPEQAGPRNCPEEKMISCPAKVQTGLKVNRFSKVSRFGSPIGWNSSERVNR